MPYLLYLHVVLVIFIFATKTDKTVVVTSHFEQHRHYFSMSFEENCLENIVRHYLKSPKALKFRNT